MAAGLGHDRTWHAREGSLGFRFFLEEFGLPVKYADGKYRVRREVSGDESRIDVEVAERRKFVIHIENKIWSAEGDDETNREWRDLAGACGVPRMHRIPRIISHSRW